MFDWISEGVIVGKGKRNKGFEVPRAQGPGGLLKLKWKAKIKRYLRMAPQLWVIHTAHSMATKECVVWTVRRHATTRAQTRTRTKCSICRLIVDVLQRWRPRHRSSQPLRSPDDKFHLGPNRFNTKERDNLRLGFGGHVFAIDLTK